MSIDTAYYHRYIFYLLVRLPSIILLVLLAFVVFGDQGLLKRNQSKQILSQINSERNIVRLQNNHLENHLLKLRHRQHNIELTGASTTLNVGENATIYRFSSSQSRSF